ncbi:glutathione-S-transferase theta, GST [Xylaria intraflava]|nr:glutathione-S-transferase theta, GST [Xylaria intraflava]
MTYTIYGYENNPRTRIIRIIAAAEGINTNEVTVIPRQNVNRDLIIEKFPRSSGKIPAFEGPKVKLTETIAIAVYLVKISDNSTLLGDGSPEHEAEILSWINWANQELLMTFAKWFLPLIPNLSIPAPYDSDSVAAGKKASLSILNTLEATLDGRKYLVGEHITLADIFIVIVLSRALEWVLDSTWRSQHPNCMRHFDMMRHWGPVKAVVPEFKLIEKETQNVNPYA